MLKAKCVEAMNLKKGVGNKNLMLASTNDCSNCLPRGALNWGAVCVRMHLRSCMDVKEPGWPSESLGVQKHKDMADT